MIQIRAIGLNIKHVNDVRHQLNITKLNDPHFLSPLAKQIKQADHVIMFRHGHGSTAVWLSPWLASALRRIRC